jgi:hypothetical protein
MIAPMLGPLLPLFAPTVVDPELDVLTHVADGQDVQSPSVWLQTSSDLHAGQLGAIGGQLTHRLNSERAGVKPYADRLLVT